MMKTIVAILIAMTIVVIGALNCHFVLTENSIIIFKKSEWGMSKTFVDARGMQSFKSLTLNVLIKFLLENNGISTKEKASPPEKNQGD
jgi:hypothetical protein